MTRLWGQPPLLGTECRMQWCLRGEGLFLAYQEKTGDDNVFFVCQGFSKVGVGHNQNQKPKSKPLPFGIPGNATEITNNQLKTRACYSVQI